MVVFNNKYVFLKGIYKIYCLISSYTPAPFHKHESRFEREQKIHVGSVDAYRPGENEVDAHPDRYVLSMIEHVLKVSLISLQKNAYHLNDIFG